ncbi:hypothetical protein [Rhizohabitans arisaemae]|uniref:hypothetical protein n=1 Tax=Rhizohabitans arisaemae TaxID=2720610 RepID=UPI0024B1D203|nr:hypothetical protein [Rhizohabitans arisaemae]
MKRLTVLFAAFAAVVLHATTAQAAPQPLSGSAVYYKLGSGGKIEVWNYASGGGGGWHKMAVTAGSGQFSASPDGTKVAWIDDKGRLHVFGSAGDKVVARNALYSGPCSTPTWSADSQRVAYTLPSTTESAPVAVVGADGRGARRVGTTLGVCHLTWSANGRHIAGYAGNTDGVHILDVTTGRSRRAPGIKNANHVQSLSPDGRNVVVNRLAPNAEGGDGSWPFVYRPTVVDTLTGAEVSIPVRGALIGALYLPDGRLVVRVKGNSRHILVVLSPQGKELQRLTEPTLARRMALLGIPG